MDIFDLISFKTIVYYLTSYNFSCNSNLKYLTLGLLKSITDYNDDLILLLQKLYSIKIQHIIELNIYTNIIINSKEQYEELIFKGTSIDIMFIMDLTGSMGSYLSETKRNIKKITEEISEHNPGSKIRLGFVGYRDYETKEEKRKYEIIDFTENIDNFITLTKKFNCYGGGDQPEDIAGGLNEALKMEWKSTARYVVLVCDAPCHGSKYHEIYIDTFKEGDPAGLEIEDLMQKFKNMNITFYCIEINSSTKKMFEIVKNVYNDESKFCVEKIYDSVENLSFIVAFSA